MSVWRALVCRRPKRYRANAVKLCAEAGAHVRAALPDDDAIRLVSALRAWLSRAGSELLRNTSQR